MSPSARRLNHDDLRWTCPKLDYEGLDPASAPFLGQERAIRSLRLGMDIHAPGYHIFVSGLTGTGRGSMVKQLLQELQTECHAVPDRCFVHNPKDPWRPMLLCFESGSGQRFQEEIGQFGRDFLGALPRTLASAALNSRRQAIREAHQAKAAAAQKQLVESCKQRGHSLVTYEENGEPDVFPVFEEEAVAPEQLSNLVREGKLSESQVSELEAARAELLQLLGETRMQLQVLEAEQTRRILEIEREAAGRLLDRLLAALREHWSGERVQAWFDDVRSSILDKLPRLHAFAVSEQAVKLADSGAIGGLEVKLLAHGSSAPLELVYERRSALEAARSWMRASCPIIYESNPTAENLFGTVLGTGGEHVSLAQIHPGSLLRAEGGYLILKLADVLRQPTVWEQLKSTLKSGLVEIRGVDRLGEPVSPLLPEPVPIDVKVILIGEPGSYDYLAYQDSEFLKVFKVHAEFDTTLSLDDDGLEHYVRQIKRLVQSEKLLLPSGEGLAAIAEQGRRMAGAGDRLSARFGRLSDLYREAAHHALGRKSEQVEREDVLKAERERRGRHALPEEHYLRSVERGTYVLQLEGSVVGQINGLSVLDKGTFAYGRPSRVTVRVGVGSSGIVDIEREADLSGSIYDKGVQILSGLLHGLFAKDTPLALHATMCFEQSYSGIDGDSASGAELFALISALSGLPLDQGIAVTGAIDQFGRIQAIGGVNEKIEGFFEVCSRRGLTGMQGVLIPESNAGELMLDPRIVEAVREERFAIYTMRDFREGLEMLTGHPAGSAREEGSVLGRAAKRLRQLAGHAQSQK